MSKIKNIVASLICSDFVGSCLASIYANHIPAWRYGRFTYDCSSENILNSVKASIFWGIYESAEVRFVREYLRSDLDVIELGASIGVVTTHILRKIGNGNKCIALEANPNLMETLKSNLEINNNGKNYHIINKAVNYNAEAEINFFLERDNVHSSINKSTGKFVKVKSAKLSDILELYKIDSYALVCDIEGTEIEILLNDNELLLKCEQLIIELHDTYYQGSKYNVESMVKLITENVGLTNITNYGTVYYFKK